MSKKLIILIGKIGSGKTTAANILKKYGFHEESFASPIKEFAITIGFKYEQVYGTQSQKLEINKYWGISGREFLQKFGTELCQYMLPKVIPNMFNEQKNIWIKIMESKIKNHPLIVISDGRFPAEINMVKDNGGVIIRIVRNNGHIYNNHISENSMDLVVEDYKILNNSSIDNLENCLLKILHKEGIYNFKF